MPRQLIAIAPREAVLQEYELPELGSGDVRVRSQFGAPKHGTELAAYRGIAATQRRRWDSQREIFLPREDEPASHFPLMLGNMTIGEVVEVGAEVETLRTGDRVFAHAPLREVHTSPAARWHPAPPGMSAEAICYWDPAEFALGAVRDAQVRLGERVAVFGLGAIGQMVVQMCCLSGAECVIAIDPIALRRQAASRHGATHALDPSEIDVGLEIRELTSGGVDAAIESSGNYSALHEAIRCVQFGGRVTPLAYYTGEARGLYLGEEWHMNRVTMISTRSISDPNRDHPMWTSERIKDHAFALLEQGRLSIDGLVHPVVDFDDCAEAYRDIDHHPERSIKLGVRFS